MRTTLTVADDVASRLRDIAQRDGISFEEAVNATLRRGLAGKAVAARLPFTVRPLKLGARTGVDHDNIGELLELG